MSRYSLNIARIGRGYGAAEGEHDLVNILVDGHLQCGLVSASLVLEGHDGCPGCCTVFVPLTVMYDGNLANEYVPYLFCTAEDGTRHYTFATRDAALTFLRRIYGIDAPQPDPEPQAAPEPSQEAPRGFELTFTVPHHDPEENDYFCEVVFNTSRECGVDVFPLPFSSQLYDVSALFGSDDLGWRIYLGSLITTQHLEGFTFYAAPGGLHPWMASPSKVSPFALTPEGVTVRPNTVNGRTLVAEGFPTLNACKGFLTFVYERLYQSLHQAPQPELDASSGAGVTHTQTDTASPRCVAAALTCDVVHSPTPLAPGQPIGSLFCNPTYPQPHQRNTQ